MQELTGNHAILFGIGASLVLSWAQSVGFPHINNFQWPPHYRQWIWKSRPCGTNVFICFSTCSLAAVLGNGSDREQSKKQIDIVWLPKVVLAQNCSPKHNYNHYNLFTFFQILYHEAPYHNTITKFPVHFDLLLWQVVNLSHQVSSHNDAEPGLEI